MKLEKAGYSALWLDSWQNEYSYPAYFYAINYVFYYSFGQPGHQEREQRARAGGFRDDIRRRFGQRNSGLVARQSNRKFVARQRMLKYKNYSGR